MQKLILSPNFWDVALYGIFLPAGWRILLDEKIRQNPNTTVL